jgi:hypothetical protein
MRHFASIIVACFFASNCYSKEMLMIKKPVAIYAICRENATCIFTGKDMLIDVYIANNSPVSIGIPLEYLRKKGLHGHLIDNETKRKITFGISLTSPELKRMFVNVNPGEHVIVSKMIKAELIQSLRPKMTDMTVNLEVAGLVKLEEGAEPVDLSQEVELIVQGQDTIDFKNKK